MSVVSAFFVAARTALDCPSMDCLARSPRPRVISEWPSLVSMQICTVRQLESQQLRHWVLEHTLSRIPEVGEGQCRSADPALRLHPFFGPSLTEHFQALSQRQPTSQYGAEHLQLHPVRRRSPARVWDRAQDNGSGRHVSAPVTSLQRKYLTKT